MALQAQQCGRLMHSMAAIALKFGVVRWLMRVGNMTFRCAVGHAKVSRAPGYLVVAAVFVASETLVHLHLQAWKGFSVLTGQVGHGIGHLLLDTPVMAIHAPDALRRMLARQHCSFTQ